MSPGETYCLDRIQKFLLRHQDGVIAYWHLGRGQWYDKVPNQHPESGRYRFSFNSPTGNSTVYRNRLIWMITHRRAVPDGFDIDHVNGNRLDDHPDNLQLMTQLESRQQGQQFSVDKTLNEVGRWFTFMGRHDREPETRIELMWIEDGFYLP